MAHQIKIKLFQSLQKYFQILGTFSPESNEIHLFKPRNIFVHICYAQMFISVLGFTLLKETTVVEFCLNYYACTAELMCMFIIASQTCRMGDISKLIENCEEFIEKSKPIK